MDDDNPPPRKTPSPKHMLEGFGALATAVAALTGAYATLRGDRIDPGPAPENVTPPRPAEVAAAPIGEAPSPAIRQTTDPPTSTRRDVAIASMPAGPNEPLTERLSTTADRFITVRTDEVRRDDRDVGVSLSVVASIDPESVRRHFRGLINDLNATPGVRPIGSLPVQAVRGRTSQNLTFAAAPADVRRRLVDAIGSARVVRDEPTAASVVLVPSPDTIAAASDRWTYEAFAVDARLGRLVREAFEASSQWRLTVDLRDANDRVVTGQTLSPAAPFDDQRTASAHPTLLVPMGHAWNIDQDGFSIDASLRNSHRESDPVHRVYGWLPAFFATRTRNLDTDVRDRPEITDQIRFTLTLPAPSEAVGRIASVRAAARH